MSQTQPQGIVVTGATGFLGGELLKRLVNQANPRNIVCPVRASSAQNAKERGVDRLTELLGAQGAATAGQHVEWIRADLEDHHMGWDSHTWRRVGSRTSEIYHCAASVSFDLELEEAHKINVDGTKHIYELAETAQEIHGTFVRFHHVSTAYASGVAAGRVTAYFLPEDKASAFRNTYERTKARAERFLRDKVSAGGPDAIPVSIYRPSIVGGDTRTGETDNWNVLYVPMKMCARGMLPVFPKGGRALVDSVGVDFVVDGMLALSDHATQRFHAFHLTAGPTAFVVDDLFRVTRAKTIAQGGKPSATKLLNRAQWAAMTSSVRLAARSPKRFRNVRRKGALAQRGLAKCGVYVPYGRVSTVFETTEVHDVLRWYGVTMPAGKTYLDTVVDYALAHDFGKRTAPAQTVTVEQVVDVTGTVDIAAMEVGA